MLEKFKRRNIATLIGPIHSLTWAPSAAQFAVISGIMPASIIFYNDKGDPDFTLGQNRRNSLFWSPNGKYLAVCGFGNLNGDIDIWNMLEKKKVSTCKLSCASNLKWSHQGDHFMCSIVTPKLRVDNKYRVYKYDCTVLTKVDFANENPLYNVLWVPGGRLDANAQNKVSSETGGKKIANFARNVEDFMGGGKADRDKVSPITTKQIRLTNEEFLWSKGIKIPDQVDEEGKVVKEKPARVPGAPSPEPEKKRKRNKKKKGETKTGLPTY